jgi:hypothetical protein
MHTTFSLEFLRGRDHFKDLSIPGRIIGCKDVDWVYLAQDRAQ